MTKRPGELGYENYKATGSIFSLHHRGVKLKGNGPPANPMTFEQFLATARAIPKPPPEGTARYADFQAQGYTVVKRMLDPFGRDAPGWDGVKRWVDER